MYSINEIAKLCGLSVYTIRFYDKEGLLPFVTRSKSGNRQFSENDLDMIKLICCLKNSGMPIKDIKRYIDLDKLSRKEVNFKSKLIEWSQKSKMEVSFELIEQFLDQDSNPVFQTEIMIEGLSAGTGTGYSKKESQQNAAQMALKKIKTNPEFISSIENIKIDRTTLTGTPEASVADNTLAQPIESDTEREPAQLSEADTHSSSLND